MGYFKQQEVLSGVLTAWPVRCWEAHFGEATLFDNVSYRSQYLLVSCDGTHQ